MDDFGKNRWWVLIAASLSVFMAQLDASIFYVNVPVVAIMITLAVRELQLGPRLPWPRREWLTGALTFGGGAAAVLLGLTLVAACVEAADYNRPIIEEFRASEGRVGGMFEGAPLLLLTHTGAGTGKRRISPLRYLADGDRILIFATNAGAPKHPAWYHNVVANPEVTVEVGTETYPATAIPLRGAERDRLYARIAEEDPAFAEYQKNTSRVIPVVALERRLRGGITLRQ